MKGKKAELNIERLAIDTLRPHEKNPRHHPEKGSNGWEVMQRSLAFDYFDPIVWNKRNGKLVSGHLRVKVLTDMGVTEADCVVVDYDEPTHMLRLIAANKAIGEDDLPALKDILEELDTGAVDMALSGYSEKELELLMNQFHDEPEEDAGPGEPPEAPVTEVGRMYQLGKHRLMCGDSTSEKDVARLMDGEKADMVFTDPPYNIDFTGSLSCTSKGGKIIKMKDGYLNPASTHDDIKNDSMTSSDFEAFITSVLGIIKDNVVGGWYICFSSSTLDELLNPLSVASMRWKSIIIWNKNQSPMGGGHFRRKYEPIVYGYFENKFYGKEYAEDDVWDITRTLKNDLHPTMKPIDLIAKALKLSSEGGNTVLDLFGGSGSTLIACEQLGRSCRMMELDPRYCDVIVRRWAKLVGQDADEILKTGVSHE